MKRLLSKLKIAVTVLMFVLLSAFFVACVGEKQKYTVRYQATEGGYISGKLEQTITEYESGISVTAVPNEGYEFVAWSDGVLTATRQETEIKDDLTLTARFSKKMCEIKYVTDGNGTLKGEISQTVAYGESGTSVTAVPNEGYEFVIWSDGLTTTVRRDTNVKESVSVTATFQKQTYTVNYITDGNGKIEGQEKQTLKYGEATTKVTAIPDEGYEFIKWSDGLTTVVRQETAVKKSLTLKATFRKKTFRVEYKCDENGRIEGEAVQMIESGGSSSIVVAVPNEGYEFDSWSDGKQEASRQDIDIYDTVTLTAKFRKKMIQVLYRRNNNGGEVKEQSTDENVFICMVPYGENAPKVKAVAEPGYVFLYWSDGLTAPERNDRNVISPITVTAYFGNSAEYKVYKGKGGKIVGKAYQEKLPAEDFETVTAKPDPGYIFSGWSDNRLESERQDTGRKSIEYYAYFEPIEKKFRYHYGLASGTPASSEVLVNRYALQTVKFVVPEYSGYTFCGWYADSSYRQKVVHSDGKLYLGYYTFLLDTDILYAKWQKEDENAPTFKVLMPMVGEVHALLYSYSPKAQKDIVVDYKMSYMEKMICALIPQKFSDCLNEWFDGKVIFEVDTYFTIHPLGTEENRLGGVDFSKTSYHAEGISYHLYPSAIPEIKDILEQYHSSLSTHCLNDRESLLRDFAGVATNKQGSICLEVLLYHAYDNLQATYEKWLSFDDFLDIEKNYIDTYLHEFVHTIESRFGSWFYQEEGFYNYHDLLSDYKYFECGLATKLYLLHQAVNKGGKIVGIPPKFWTEPSVWGERYIEKL